MTKLNNSAFSTPLSDIGEIQVSVSDARARGEIDFNFFAGLCIPDIFLYAFPNYYLALFAVLCRAMGKESTEKILRYAIGLPRGFVKTTFLKILIVWLVVFDRVTFVLIVCATEPLAENFLDDVNSMLCSPNIASIFGRWHEALATDNRGLKKASYHGRVVILRAIGAQTAARGINIDNKRPDFVCCDDMQTKENDESDADRDSLFRWFIGTLLKAVNRHRSLVMYTGNMYSDQCILYKLKQNPYWISLVTGAILEDGTPLWSELASLEDLFEGFKHDESLGQANIWFAEIMNDPVESVDGLIRGPFPQHKLGDLIPEPTASFVTLDPAGFRRQADDNVATAHYVIDGKTYVAEMDGGIWDPGVTCEKTIELALRHQSSLIGIEDAGYQMTLQYWMARVMKEENIEGIVVVPIQRGIKSKESHIRLFVKELYAGEYSFLRDQDRQKFTWQAAAYRLGKKTNKDDWLDSPSMGLEVRNTYWNLLTVRAHQGQFPNAHVVGDNTPF